MAMVEVPGGLAVGSRSNHGRRTTHRKLEGRLEKAERRAIRKKKQVTTDGETPVTIPFISLGVKCDLERHEMRHDLPSLASSLPRPTPKPAQTCPNIKHLPRKPGFVGITATPL
eukprot:scaffold171200_cov26-Cyclotella_meneghiniana.AAC.1